MIRVYKEGQGIWARGVMAGTIGVTGLFAAVSTYQYCQENSYLGGNPIPYVALDGKSLMAIVLLIPFFVVGVWLYNHPRFSDFLIDTESELKNKVTWPTRQETINNSIVVVITCIILGIWIVLADVVFQTIKDWIYQA